MGNDTQEWEINPRAATVVETSLRILDSNTPNLKDAAFAYCHIETEMGDPLVSSLAKISDWGDIDLSVDLGSEHQGSLQRFAKVSRSPEIARDRPRSPEIARDRPRSPKRALESTREHLRALEST